MFLSLFQTLKQTWWYEKKILRFLRNYMRLYNKKKCRIVFSKFYHIYARFVFGFKIINKIVKPHTWTLNGNWKKFYLKIYRKKHPFFLSLTLQQKWKKGTQKGRQDTLKSLYKFFCVFFVWKWPVVTLDDLKMFEMMLCLWIFAFAYRIFEKTMILYGWECMQMSSLWFDFKLHFFLIKLLEFYKKKRFLFFTKFFP